MSQVTTEEWLQSIDASLSVMLQIQAAMSAATNDAETSLKNIENEMKTIQSTIDNAKQIKAGFDTLIEQTQGFKDILVSGV